MIVCHLTDYITVWYHIRHMGLRSESQEPLHMDEPGSLPNLADLSPLPSSSLPDFRPTSNLLPVLYDSRAIAGVLETILSRAGMDYKDAALKLGMNPKSLKAYLYGQHVPSLVWFVRFVNIMGGAVTVAYPK
jgi:hypothetical protein